MASENIWREFDLAKEAGKPVVVSMGDYAASGGYYIACMADKILAEPNTITGSIGVFSMIPNLSNLYNEKLGIYGKIAGNQLFGLGPHAWNVRHLVVDSVAIHQEYWNHQAHHFGPTYANNSFAHDRAVLQVVCDSS